MLYQSQPQPFVMSHQVFYSVYMRWQFWIMPADVGIGLAILVFRSMSSGGYGAPKLVPVDTTKLVWAIDSKRRKCSRLHVAHWLSCSVPSQTWK